MNRSLRRMLVLLALAGALGAAASASAAPNQAAPAVFVQTNELAGNHVVVYDRSATGSLTPAGTYATGGNGGAAAGAVSDRLASQGSLLYDPQHGLLVGVNAGSDSVYVFAVNGDHLALSQVVPSGGSFPASVAVHGDLLYVLNAGGDGNINGFRVAGGRLHPLPGSNRALGLGNTNPPFFLTSPGQVGFTPDGAKLIVTTKASTNAIDVFSVQPNGRPSAAPVVNTPATPVPFAFTFQPGSERLVDGEAGQSTLTTYAVQADGTLGDSRSLADGQVALCWITRVGGYYYVSNTGSNTVSGYSLAADGTPSLVGPTGVVAATETGTIDSAAAADSFLYVQTGVGGTVDEFRVGGNGTLTQIGTVTGLPPGMEGIAAS
jgi:lactonase family protein with 7-bladed beta-propeller